MDKLYPIKHSIFSILLVALIAIPSPALFAQSPDKILQLKNLLQQSLAGSYTFDDPNQFHESNTEVINNFFFNLLSATSVEQLDAYTASFIDVNFINHGMKKKDILFTAWLDTVFFLGGVTIGGIVSEAINESKMIQGLPQHYFIPKEERMFLNGPQKNLLNYIESGRHAFPGIDAILNDLHTTQNVNHPSNSFNIQFMRNGRRVSASLKPNELHSLVNAVSYLPKEHVQGFLEQSFIADPKKSFLQTLEKSTIHLDKWIIDQRIIKNLNYSHFIKTYIPSRLKIKIAIPLFLGILGACVAEGFLITNDPGDYNSIPGFIEFNFTELFTQKIMDALKSNDFATLSTVYDQYPMLTAMLAHSIRDIPRAVNAYNKIVEELE